MVDLVVARSKPYFRNQDPDHDVLKRGDRGVACANIRRAMERLGLGLCPNGPVGRLYDEAPEVTVKRFQQQFGR